MMTKYLIVCVADNFLMAKKEIEKLKEKNQNIINVNIIDTIDFVEKNINRIDRYLKEFGAPPKLKGYQYVKEAINICIMYNHQIKIYKDIYAILSDKYNTTDTAIESAIRRLIEKTMDNAPWEVKNRVFSSIIYNEDEDNTPSNLLFIKTIAERIIMELKKETTLFL